MAETADSFKLNGGKSAWPPEALLDEVPTEFVMEKMQTDHSTVVTQSELSGHVQLPATLSKP
ncbi:hypothetical protein E4U25_005493 [Claviceps purpurea]|nr:hypothetical protein E4U28_008537 [Claviceps purpurea]KAG6234880.1 hypothetical protein E4U25_005493 [Claviceps purpurea]